MAPPIEQIMVDEDFADDPRQWLANQAQMYDLRYLLIHADDGVIWGLYENGHLRLSSEIFSSDAETLDVKLRAVTTQQARLFGPAGELLLWRTDDGFDARLIADGEAPESGTLPEEQQYLWGTVVESRNGFTLMEEGQQGLYHALPLVVPQGQRAALKVRHYLDYDDQGQAYISGSRLVDVIKAEEEENGA